MMGRIEKQLFLSESIAIYEPTSIGNFQKKVTQLFQGKCKWSARWISSTAGGTVLLPTHKVWAGDFERPLNYIFTYWN